MSSVTKKTRLRATNSTNTGENDKDYAPTTSKGKKRQNSPPTRRQMPQRSNKAPRKLEPEVKPKSITHDSEEDGVLDTPDMHKKEVQDSTIAYWKANNIRFLSDEETDSETSAEQPVTVQVPDEAKPKAKKNAKEQNQKQGTHAAPLESFAGTGTSASQPVTRQSSSRSPDKGKLERDASRKKIDAKHSSPMMSYTYYATYQNDDNIKSATDSIPMASAKEAVRAVEQPEKGKKNPNQTQKVASVAGPSNSACAPVVMESKKETPSAIGTARVLLKKLPVKSNTSNLPNKNTASRPSTSAQTPENPARCPKCQSCTTCFPNLKVQKLKAPNEKVKTQFKKLSRDQQSKILKTKFKQFHKKFRKFKENNGKGLELYGFDRDMRACVYCTHYGIKIKKDKGNGFHVFTELRFYTHYQAFHKKPLVCEFCQKKFDDKFKLLGHHTSKKKDGCYKEYRKAYPEGKPKEGYICTDTDDSTSTDSDD